MRNKWDCRKCGEDCRSGIGVYIAQAGKCCPYHADGGYPSNPCVGHKGSATAQTPDEEAKWCCTGKDGKHDGECRYSDKNFAPVTAVPESAPPVETQETRPNLSPKGENMNHDKPLKIWSIGEESELFAARSEEEVRAFYAELVGADEAAEAFESDFTERDLDEEREFDFDGAKKTMTLAELLSDIHANTKMPNQVSTSYN